MKRGVRPDGRTPRFIVAHVYCSDAGTGDRTRKPLRAQDFKSRAFASFAIPARGSPMKDGGASAPPSSRSRAGNGTRTRDPNLGKVVLYQLSYSRVGANIPRARTRR